MIAWIGGGLLAFFLFVFVYVIQVRIKKWNDESISPLPLEGVLSISSYISALIGLTIMFTGVLETFTFSPINSLISSLVLSFSTGIPMWGVVKGLLREVESGDLKEIVPGKFWFEILWLIRRMINQRISKVLFFLLISLFRGLSEYRRTQCVARNLIA